MIILTIHFIFVLLSTVCYKSTHIIIYINFIYSGLHTDTSIYTTEIITVKDKLCTYEKTIVYLSGKEELCVLNVHI